MIIPRKAEFSDTPGDRRFLYETTYPGSQGTTESFTFGGLRVLNHKVTESFETSDKVHPTDYTTCTTKSTIYNIAKQLNQFRNYYDRYEWEEYSEADRAASLYGALPISLTYINSTSLMKHTLNWNLVRLNDVNNRVLEKLNEDSANLGAFIVELGETVSYVCTIAADIINFGRAIASGRFNKAVRQVGISKKRWASFVRRPDNSVASRWLEFNFAIKPLVGDIANIAALHRDPLAALQALRYNVRSTLRGTSTVPVEFGYDGLWPGSSCFFDFATTVSCSFSISDPEVLALKALGLYNAPAALYEGVPFSWLFDYAVNLGAYLGMLTAPSGFAFAYGYQSCRVNQNTSIYALYRDERNANYGKYTVVYNRRYMSGSVITSGYFRKKLDGFPAPTLTYVLDDITLRQSSYVASLISLFTSKR